MTDKYRMRYHEICEGTASSRAYDYHFVGRDVQTHEFPDTAEYRGGRLDHPIETTRYAFESENGLNYIVHCKLQNHVLDVSFTVLGGRYDLNGAGDAFRVLATVSAIVGDYCREDVPRAITFSAKAEERSRVKLYDVMTQRSAQYFPGFILVRRKRFGRNIEYLLHRPLTAADQEADEVAREQKAAAAAARDAEIARAAEERRKAREAETAAYARQQASRTPQEIDAEFAEIERMLGLV